VKVQVAGLHRSARAEIGRTLRLDAPFVLESPSPTAFGHTFRNFSYPHAGPLRSGETTPCIVTTPGGQFVIEDTYWTEDDYVDAVERADLAVIRIDYPRPHDPAAWSTDEASIPPCIVIQARKAGDRVTLTGSTGRTLHSENPGGFASSGLCSWNARAAGRVRIQS